MKVLIFDIFGSFGQYKKFYTTSSALTYPFPPPTAIRGLIGAILGYKRSEYLEKTKTLRIGVQILNPIRIIKTSINYISTKEGEYELNKKLSNKKGSVKITRTQVIKHILVEPKFRIYVSGEGETFDELKSSLEKGEFFYTPVLGTSEYLAEVEYVGCYPIRQVENYKGSCFSICPVEFWKDPEITSVKLGKELIPYDLDKDRLKPKYVEVLYSKDPKVPIKGVFEKIWLVENLGEGFAIALLPHEA